MQVSTTFVAVFILCTSLCSALMIYIRLLCYPTRIDGSLSRDMLKETTGLSASDLNKLPNYTGKDLVVGTECAVCLDEIEGAQPVRMIPGCNHAFHLQCADTWLAKNPICPVCRATIRPQLLNSDESNAC